MVAIAKPSKNLPHLLLGSLSHSYLADLASFVLISSQASKADLPQVCTLESDGLRFHCWKLFCHVVCKSKAQSYMPGLSLKIILGAVEADLLNEETE